MAASTVPAARSWLTSQLLARSEVLTAGAVVFNGSPTKDNQPNVVVVGKVVRKVNALAFMGNLSTRGTLQEDYMIEVIVSCRDGGDPTDNTGSSRAAVYATATTLTDAVIDIVRTDPTMGGNVLRSAPLDIEDADMGVNWTPQPNIAMVAEQTIQIAVTAVI